MERTQKKIHRENSADDFKVHDPIGSMYGIFANIYHKKQLNVGEYTIHGGYGDGFPPPPATPQPKANDFTDEFEGLWDSLE